MFSFCFSFVCSFPYIFPQILWEPNIVLNFIKLLKLIYGYELNKDGLFLKLRTSKIRQNKMITKVYQNYDIDKSLQLYLGVKSYKIVWSSYKLLTLRNLGKFNKYNKDIPLVHATSNSLNWWILE